MCMGRVEVDQRYAIKGGGSDRLLQLPATIPCSSSRAWGPYLDAPHSQMLMPSLVFRTCFGTAYETLVIPHSPICFCTHINSLVVWGSAL